jgi:hypothetical protein
MTDTPATIGGVFVVGWSVWPQQISLAFRSSPAQALSSIAVDHPQFLHRIGRLRQQFPHLIPLCDIDNNPERIVTLVLFQAFLHLRGQLKAFGVTLEEPF